MDNLTHLVYRGSKSNLPSTRNAASFYLCEDTREVYFGPNLYTEGVRFYSGTKPTSPAQGVLYIDETSGAGDTWNGTAWVSVFTGIVSKNVATTIGASANDNEVPTAKAVKDYVAGITGEELGALAHKDKVEKTDLADALKTELEGKAEKTVVDTLIGTDTGKSARTIANEELAKQLIPDNAKESLDTLAEIATWIQAHPDDASAMNQAIDALEALVGTLPEDATATTIVGYIKEYTDAAITALKIGDYAKAVDLTAAVTRITALETDTHTHANKTELDLIATGDKAKWDSAATKAHEHANKAVLDGITAEKVTNWDAAVEAVTVGSF